MLSVDAGSRFAAILVASVVIAEILHRLLSLPRITGYVLGGVLFGPSVMALATLAEVRSFGLFVEMVLGLLLFELGSRADVTWLRNNPWLLVASYCEALATFVAVLLMVPLESTMRLPAAALLLLAYFLCGSLLLGAIVALVVNLIFAMIAGRDADASILALSMHSTD